MSEEALAAACAEKVKQLEFSVKQSAFDSVRQELETELAIARVALLALRERAEPVEPVWRAEKYPVNRPIPGSQLVVWDETGKFVGYGSAVDTRKSGVAIQMSDGCRFDSNHLLRWEYALQAPPAPVAAGWIACSERMPEHGRDVQVFCSDTREQFVAYRCIGDDDFQYGFYEDVALVCNPTHWMPLPEAPGKEG